jgi:hypothetical protein
MSTWTQIKKYPISSGIKCIVGKILAADETVTTFTATVPGARTGNRCVISPENASAVAAGLAGAAVTAKDTVTVTLTGSKDLAGTEIWTLLVYANQAAS